MHVNVDALKETVVAVIAVGHSASGPFSSRSPQRSGDRVGGVSSGSAWLDSGQGGSVCLFDKKSSVRKENKQSGVLLLQSQRKSFY